MLKEVIISSDRFPRLSGKAPATQLVYDHSRQPEVKQNTDAVFNIKAGSDNSKHNTGSMQ